LTSKMAFLVNFKEKFYIAVVGFDALTTK